MTASRASECNREKVSDDAPAAYPSRTAPASDSRTPPRCSRTWRNLTAAAPLFVLLLFAAACSDIPSDPPSLFFVQSSDGATLTQSTLVLTGVNEQTAWFTDRPDRETGQVFTSDFLSLWDEGKNSFVNDPPNADFTCEVDGRTVNYVVTLTAPAQDQSRLSYAVEFIGPGLVYGPVNCDATAHLFIDSENTSSAAFCQQALSCAGQMCCTVGGENCPGSCP